MISTSSSVIARNQGVVLVGFGKNIRIPRRESLPITVHSLSLKTLRSSSAWIRRAYPLKKRTWGDLRALWVAHWSERTEIRALQLVAWIGLSRSKFYSWRDRYGSESTSFLR